MTKLAEHVNRLICWWAALDPTKRRALYRPLQLAHGAGIPIQSIPTAAALAGWQRAERWLIGHDGRRKHRVFYAPPGEEVPESAPRGRPEASIYTMLNRRPPSPFDVTDAPVADGQAIPSNVVAMGAYKRAPLA